MDGMIESVIVEGPKDSISAVERAIRKMKNGKDTVDE